MVSTSSVGTKARGCPRWPGCPPRLRPLAPRRARFLSACGGSLDGGREELCESCWRRSSKRWTAASHSARRASRVRIYSRTARGVCSHSSGGNGGGVFMGLNHTRDGYLRASLTYCDHVNAYKISITDRPHC